MTVLVDTIAEMRRRTDSARAAGARVGLVPTMGYLHEGHRSLMRAARRATDLVVASIFVNPLQFGPNEDLDRYPRDLPGDRAAAEAEGVDVLFVPSRAEMYPRAPRTTVHVDGLTAGLCGAARPTHFDGVTTVVAKLFSIVGPCAAFFGRKDHQQLVVVSRMVEDLDLPVEVVGCPLVREADGLALSSRNAYLAPDARVAATALFRSLRRGLEVVGDGERDAGAVARSVRAVLDDQPGVDAEYVEVRDASELEPIVHLDGDVLLAVAARVGGVRLIDNIRVTVDGAAVVADLGTGFVPGGRER